MEVAWPLCHFHMVSMLMVQWGCQRFQSHPQHCILIGVYIVVSSVRFGLFQSAFCAYTCVLSLACSVKWWHICILEPCACFLGARLWCMVGPLSVYTWLEIVDVLQILSCIFYLFLGTSCALAFWWHFCHSFRPNNGYIPPISAQIVSDCMVLCTWADPVMIRCESNSTRCYERIYDDFSHLMLRFSSQKATWVYREECRANEISDDESLCICCNLSMFRRYDGARTL